MKRRSFLKSWAFMLSGALAWRFPWWQAAAQGQAFLLPPTVQHLTEDSATICFELAQPPHDGRLILEREGRLVQEVAFAQQPRQLLRLSGLEGGSHYSYRVEVGGEVPPLYGMELAWEGLSFRTPPYDRALRVAMVGDSGFGSQATYRLAELMAAQEPHLFFHLGDLVYHMNEYENDPYLNWNLKYFAPLYPVLRQAAHYPTFGNHDRDAAAQVDGVPFYYSVFPPLPHLEGSASQRDWYSFDVDNIQFICLNSQVFYSFGSLIAPQEEWLTERLAREDVRYTVIFCHVPPYTSAGVHQWDGQILVEKWVPKFQAAAANVALVASGHAHLYERLHINGMHYLIAGAGSEVVYGLGEPLAGSQITWTDTSFPVLDFYEDHIHLEAYTLEGNLIESIDLPVRNRG